MEWIIEGRIDWIVRQTVWNLTLTRCSDWVGALGMLEDAAGASSVCLVFVWGWRADFESPFPHQLAVGLNQLSVLSSRWRPSKEETRIHNDKRINTRMNNRMHHRMSHRVRNRMNNRVIIEWIIERENLNSCPSGTWPCGRGPSIAKQMNNWMNNRMNTRMSNRMNHRMSHRLSNRMKIRVSNGMTDQTRKFK